MKTQRLIAHSLSAAVFLATIYACSNREVPEGQVNTGATSASGPNATTGGQGTVGGVTNTVTGGSTGTTTSGVGGAAATATGGTSAGATITGAGGTEVVLTTNGTTGGMDVEMVNCVDEVLQDPYAPGYQISAQAQQQAQTALGQMSVADKANQMRGTPSGAAFDNWDDIFRSMDDTNNGVKGFLFRDGPRGANLDAPFVDSSGSYIGATATAFPVSVARGAAFDLDLEYRIGMAIGDETLASRNTMLLAPTINTLRHPAWGRAQETYGEDAFLLGRMGAAFTVGAQQFIPACVKHYMANNVEGGRESFDAGLDAQTMREIYGFAFEMVVREAGVACVMAAYNKVNGVKSAENQELLTNILRNEWGFKGMVLTDWWAMEGGRTIGSDSQEQALDGIQGGLDMELPWSLHYSHLETLVDSQQISEADLDVSALRILEQKYRFNVAAISGQPGLRTPSTSFSGSGITNNTAHIELAYEAALKGAVLLKNDNNTLPITGATNVAVLGRTVAYVGNEESGVAGGMINFATGVITGDSGSSRVVHDRSREVSPATGIQTAGGVTVTTGTTAAEAGNADFVVVVVGRTPNDEGEEYTGAQEPNGNFYLDAGNAGGEQNTLVQDVIALGKPMVVVLIGGSVVDMPWLANVPAVVMAWYPGMVGGRAIGDLLFGKANFSGKLPFTWPDNWSQEPTFTNGAGVSMPYDHGYRHFDRNGLTPLFPFGHGLSYTSFSYDQLQLGCTDVTAAGVLKVNVDVSNAGTVAGDETILVFASYTASSRNTQHPAPVKELKGFQRVHLDPGQAKRVTIPVRMADLKYWDTATNSWQVERGTLNIQVGPNAGNLPLSASVPVL